MVDRHVVMLGPSPTSRGGMSSVIQTYQKAGWFNRWRVVFLSTTETEKRLGQKIAIGLRSLCRFVGWVCGNRITLVHAHIATGISLWRKSLFLTLAKIAGIPTIFHLHGGTFANYYRTGSWLKRKIIDQLLKQSDAIVVLSTQWQQSLQQITDNPNICVVYNPVADFDPPPDPVQRKKQLLFLGEITASKGIDDLIDATSRLSKTFPDLTVCCAGSGELGRVRKRVQALNLERIVTFPGWIDAETRRYLLAESTCFVLPSYREGLPMSILEAMSAGLPTISTRVGGIPDEITDGLEGFLVAPGDVDGLTEKLTILLTDDTLCLKMGKAAQEKVQKFFTLEQALGRLDRLYRSLLHSRP